MGWPDSAELREMRLERVRVQGRLLAGLVSGSVVSVPQAHELVEDLADLASRHFSRFCQLASPGARVAASLADHMYTVSALCVAMACRLGWSEGDVRLAGLAGLLSDAGMALVPARLRELDRALDDAELNRVRRHTAYSVAMLESCGADIPDEVTLAAYQHHERENGSGYPRGLRGAQIHDLSRLVAVADVYAALTGHRAYRGAVIPYRAMEQMIQSAGEKLLHRPYIRALVEVCGLFPVGSMVKLSDSRLAEVIGSHTETIDRPIVRTLGREGEVIDLARVEPWELSVIRALKPCSISYNAA